jgi:hypothetical protein
MTEINVVVRALYYWYLGGDKRDMAATKLIIDVVRSNDEFKELKIHQNALPKRLLEMLSWKPM